MLLLLQIPMSWGQTLSFRNDREGKSSYDTKSNSKKIDKILKKINAEDIIDSYQQALSKATASNVCAFDLNKKFIDGLDLKKTTSSDFEGAVFYLRANDLLDDVASQILLNAYEVSEKKLFNTSGAASVLNKLEADVLKKVATLFTQLNKNYFSRYCYDEAYRLFHSDLGKIVTFNESVLRDIFIEARTLRWISNEDYTKLEKARLSTLHMKTLSLKDYNKKIKSLRIQYPLANAQERSDFVTLDNGAGLTHRQQLLVQYNEIQIILMSNLIKKLRARLESDRIEIMVYDDNGNAIEVIPLDPMERFRFTLKLLRKEMTLLAINSQFKGRAPTYMDLIAASFETGLVAGSELNQLGSLEEIWNPKKTLWDKASFWVRSFSSVATVLIPPPYGFIPILAMVAIEATMQNRDTAIDDGSLF